MKSCLVLWDLVVNLDFWEYFFDLVEFNKVSFEVCMMIDRLCESKRERYWFKLRCFYLLFVKIRFKDIEM